jgi:hypothetical protein
MVLGSVNGFKVEVRRMTERTEGHSIPDPLLSKVCYDMSHLTSYVGK